MNKTMDMIRKDKRESIYLFAPGKKSMNMTESIKQFEDAYVVSITKADIELGRILWLDSPETTFSSPFGVTKGFEAVTDSVYNVVMGGFASREFVITNMDISVFGDCAAVDFDCEQKAVSKDGKALNMKLKESHTLLLKDGEWKIAHHIFSFKPPERKTDK